MERMEKKAGKARMPISRAGICNSRGFTLLELIAVMFIISVVAAIALPSFIGVGESKIKSEAREMASILTYMNDSAASRKETFVMRFDFDNNTVFWKGPEGEKTKKFDDMTGVTTQAAGTVLKGELTVLFEPFGVRENISVHMSRRDKNMTITLNHLSGRVKIKDEAGSREDENGTRK
jgi:prepilin-type N-terminal cleavage/methylation domain-containing protein